MERLTIKNSDGTHSQVTETKFIQFFDKVAEFEDFMEEQKVESLEHLAYYLETLKKARKVNGELNVECCKQKKENQALKDRWQKLKEWAGYLCYFELVDKMEKLEKVMK